MKTATLPFKIETSICIKIISDVEWLTKKIHAARTNSIGDFGMQREICGAERELVRKREENSKYLC